MHMIESPRFLIVKRNNVIIYSECKKDFAFAINDDLQNSTNIIIDEK